MGTPRRLPSGGRIDRDRPIAFSFNGREMRGFAGDTLASALLAHGVATVARSFKYGRPRGIVGHGVEEPNAIVDLGTGAATVPNVRATEAELFPGLEARTSRAPWQGAVGPLARHLPAGFYYKMFLHARGFRTWERFLRATAGLGGVPEGADPDTYDHLNHHCDVLVVGAGPAGLAAALEACRAGARVVLADEQAEFGGSLLAEPGAVGGEHASSWIARTVAELESHPDVLLLARSTVSGLYDHNFVTVVERRPDAAGAPDVAGARERLHRIRAGQVVLATGAIERPLVFANNDLPGVMLAASVLTYLHRYAVVPGERMVLCTTNDSAYRTAIDWAGAGREVAAIVDARPEPSGAAVQAATRAGIEVIHGHAVIEARGRKRVREAVVAPLHGDEDRLTGPPRRIGCDLIACSGGWSPTLHLASQTGVKPRWSDEAIAFLPREAGRWGHLGRIRRRRAHVARLPGDGCRRRRLGGFADRSWRRPCLRGTSGNGRASGGAVAGPVSRTAPAPPEPGAQAVRGPAARRDGRGHRAGRSRRVRIRGAREALHGPRFRHGAGQARQRERRRDPGARPGPGHRRYRDHDVSAVLHARHVRRGRGQGRGGVLRSRAAHAHARLARGAGRRVGRRRQVETAALLPKGRRGHAGGGRPRMSRGAGRRRHPRRVDARQDRHPGRRRPCLPRPHLHDRLPPARRRALPIRPDAARGRHDLRRRRHRPHRRAPLPDAHDHRQRRGRLRLARALAADRVARPRRLLHVGDRSLGHRGPRRAEVAGSARQGLRRHRPVPRRVPLHGRARGPRGGRPRARVPHQLQRRAVLRGERARPPGPGSLGHADRGGPRSSGSRRTAPRPCTSFARRKASSSSGRTPTAP